MAFIDYQLLLSDAQAITVDAVSESVLDFGSPTVKRRIGTGEPMVVAFQVDVAAIHDDADETYELQLIQSDNADLSNPDILVKETFAYTELAAGKIVYLPVPPGRPTKQYFGAYYNTGGTTPSVTLTAWLAPQSMIESRTDYAIGSAML